MANGAKRKFRAILLLGSVAFGMIAFETEVYPLDNAVIQRAMALPVSLEMHDAQIVATGLICIEGGTEAKIITADRSIIDSRLLPIVW